MDAEILDAVAVVDIDPAQAREWFDLVNGAHSASGDDWDTFSEQLRSTAGGGFGAATEIFLEYVADHGKTELISRLVANPDELPGAYASLREGHAEPAADDSAWDTVVQQFGPGWEGWDGSEEGWAQFRDWTTPPPTRRTPPSTPPPTRS